jgi:hypothetical protein
MVMETTAMTIMAMEITAMRATKNTIDQQGKNKSKGMLNIKLNPIKQQNSLI